MTSSNRCRATRTANCPPASPLAVIYDAAPKRSERRQDLTSLAGQFPAARVIVLMEYPRYDEIEQARNETNQMEEQSQKSQIELLAGKLIKA